MRHLTALILVATLGGCSTLPDLAEPPQALGVEADYPPFVPIDQVTFDQAETERADLETEDALTARIAGLRARAAQLRRAEAP